jgi:type II secretory pathway pseudopilin PulG
MKRRRGLTLVELVVVMVLLLFIGLSVGGLVRLVRDTEQSINRTTEMNQTGRVVLQRIASELSSAMPLPVITDETQGALMSATEFGELGAMGTGVSTLPSVLTFYHEDALDTQTGLDLDTLRFTTANADPRRSNSPQGDTIEVAYYIDTDPQTLEQGLVRSLGTLPGLLPEDALTVQTLPEVLSERVVSLNFRFYDADTGEWLDTWDYTDALPALVEITIGIAPEPCDEFLARLEQDKSALAFVEWLTTTVPIRVRSYPDPSVQLQQQQQQQAGQPTFPMGAQQAPPTQQQPTVPTTQPAPTIPQLPPAQIPPQIQRPSGAQTGPPTQRPSAPSFQQPPQPPQQQRPTFGTRPQQGGGQRR